jgi:predicted  nucleic acid-binding Zn-ribbon protein
MVRGVTELSGLREIRTIHSTKKRSIPRVQSSAYLDLYMLKKEKDRLEKEIYILDKRKKSMQKRQDEIDLEMKKLEEAEARGRQANPEVFKKNPEVFKKPSGKDWKTMPLKY